MMLQPASTLFESELELRYFRLFSDRIAVEICPYFNPDAWSQMILQACMSEASIRHAAIAIGALGKTYEMAQAGRCPVSGETIMLDMDRLPAPGTTRESRTRLGSISDDTAYSEAYMHHRQALEQYDKAIKRMRNDISSGSQSLRTALITCIIVICFEAIHGNHESAAGQLQSGLKLIQQWVAGQQRSLQYHPQGFASPAPEVVEDFLVQSFGRMEIQSMSVFDPRKIEVHSALKHEGKETIQAMPAQFVSIDQARVYLDLITRRLMHFTSSIHVPRNAGASLDLPKMPPPPTNREQVTPWNDVIHPMPWCDGKIPLSNTSSALSSSPLIIEQESHATELKNWTTAFAPLLTFSQASGGQDAISALTMSISAIASQISLRAAFFINESAYDIFIPEFHQIVNLSSNLLQLQSSRSRSRSSPSPSPDSNHSTGTGGNNEPLIHFAFDIGVVPPLYLVIVKCRDRKLRRQALKLMEENPRREGVWDSVTTVALGRWVIGLEEEGTRRFSSASPHSNPSPSCHPSPSPSHASSTESTRSRTVSRGPGASPGLREDGWGRAGRYGSIGSPNHIYGDEDEEDMELVIPEEMRVRKAAMRFDLLERRANLGCLQMDVEQKRFVQKSEVFTW
ncbi:uncharacterized protein PAC_05005 [Phialocephala subalpina]|uniref:Uncharacterized protein n=1 Tax=Phialocephala subalpina TaxID=576137 RepID=A0A1L7WQR8_9HELO|nr:uncharacterized protein PAC_05005 [Phialocephala subalpina]